LVRNGVDPIVAAAPFHEEARFPNPPPPPQGHQPGGPTPDKIIQSRQIALSVNESHDPLIMHPDIMLSSIILMNRIARRSGRAFPGRK
jgi:hypothetical protein